MKRIVMAGASGFIGRALCNELAAEYEVVGLSRDAARAEEGQAEGVRFVQWDAESVGDWAGEVDGAYAVIDMAGENVGSGRWNAEKKRQILASRLNGARALVEAVRGAKEGPEVFVYGSAMGYYGSRAEQIVDENTGAGEGFLSRVCIEAEGEAQKASEYCRVVLVRTGVVLGRDGGALPRLIKPFKFGFGGYVGSGRQWVPWVSIADEVRGVRFLLEREGAERVYNLVSPFPCRMSELCESLGRVLGQRCWMRVPGFVLRGFLGEMADEVMLGSYRVLPGRLQEEGFEFSYERVEDALWAILGDVGAIKVRG